MKIRFISANNVPLISAKRADRIFFRRNILSKITTDGTTKIEVIIPKRKTFEEMKYELMDALQYSDDNWEFSLTTFTELSTK